MQSINISKRKYETLKQIELPDDVMSTEANFYKLSHMGKLKVFKSLHRTSGTLFANKLFTLEMLNAYRAILPRNFVIPEALVTVEKNIKGFIMPYIKGVTLEAYLADAKVPLNDKIKYLKQIGSILDKLEHIRQEAGLDCIYLNDLHASNFIIEEGTGKLKVEDLDSCKICDSKPKTARYLTPLSLFIHVKNNNKYDIYRKDIFDKVNVDDPQGEYCKYKNYKDELGFVNSNENSDLYCYAITFLNFIYGGNVGLFGLNQFYDYMNYLEWIGFDSKLVCAIMKIVSNAPNKNIAVYLDSITEEQVCRANHKVYKIVKNSKSF